MFTNFLGGMDADVTAHLSRISSTDGTLHTHLAQLITSLKSKGLWDKIAILCVVHDTSADSLLNLKGATTNAPDSTLTSAAGFGTPTFTANRGFLCESGDPNGEAANNVNFGVSEANATGYGLYDAHFFTYCRTDATALSAVLAYHDYSLNDGNKIFTWSSGFGPTITIQGSSVQIPLATKPAADQKGFMFGSCSAIDSRYFRVNDSTTSDSTSTAYTLESAGTQTIQGKENESGTSYASRQHAAWGWGTAMTIAESGDYENIIRTYMQARGADVY